MPSVARQTTSRDRLQADWNEKRPSVEEALSVEDAIKYLRGDDPRPLLVLRDCDGCANKEGDLVKRTLVDERFLLGTHWFNCVKLPANVIERDHPLSNLFRGNKPAHVIVATNDAKTVVSVTRFGQKDIWKAMTRVLRKDYKKSPDSAMKGMMKLLAKYDALDERENVLRDQVKAKREKGKTLRVAVLEKELEKLAEKRKELNAEEKEVRGLKLRNEEEEAEKV